MSSRVTVVVLNWNGKQLLGGCLHSLEAQTFRDFEIVVVDNGSEDGSVSFLNRRFPAVRVIANEENLGFAAANNQAIRASDSEFVATLNNDAQAAPNWLEELVHAADGDSEVGACASMMLLAGRPGVIDGAGIALDRAAIAWNCRGGEQDDPEEEGPVEVFGACAGAALYRRALLDDVGLFDEDFFAYLEDVDLAWRARWAGWKAVLVPTARVLHVHSGTGERPSFNKSVHMGRNKVWLIAKNYPWPQLAWYLPAILLYDLAALPYVLISRGNCGALRGRIEGLAGLGGALRKRRVALGSRRASASEVMDWLAPLPTPWTLWRRYAYLKERPGEFTGRKVQDEG